MSRKTAEPTKPDVDETVNLKQAACILHMLAGDSQRTIAQLLSIDESTISRWKQDPGFLAALGKAQADVQSATVERLRGLQGKALDALADLLDSIEPKIRLSAASAILERSGLTLTAPGPTDPADIVLQQKTKEQDRAFKGMWVN